MGKVNTRQSSGFINGEISHFFSLAASVRYFLILFLCLAGPQMALSQRIAVLAPIKSEQSAAVVGELKQALSEDFNVLDQSMIETIFDSFSFDNPYNLTKQESINFGAGSGSNFFILVRSDTLRRTSFERDEYYESYQAVFLVSARTGALTTFTYLKFEADSLPAARKQLFDSIPGTAAEIKKQIEDSLLDEIDPEPAAAQSLASFDANPLPGLRPPLPYLRMKPAYTAVAGLYDILATVDVEVEIDSAGNVVDTDIVRWAGFGLDESVIKTVREMKWRPADLDGKPLAMRILLRYNFSNIETDN